MALKMLDMLQHKIFRDKLKDPKFIDLLKVQLVFHAEYSAQKLAPSQQPPSTAINTQI